ncbi:Zn2+-binding dehydrogenase [Klebsormidium nitens]|uniref:Zn2+-binding dehydrogenase n=1 Tax=Klebsormidium nitens TaxID=105231 RepID=A0A1Y1HPZ2_KLENI|nr:Zn2+-binding dehydrogenase [Klebsormidium nitens]|eukprot:GAQ80143.1 Zn2+-binding dehydrogenase [Klebsormidium nitens]
MAGQDQRAVLIRKFDQAHYLDYLEVGRRPKPQPKDGEVLIRMLARPIDPADVLSLKGIYPGFRPSELPAVPGLEGMGKVEEVGHHVTALEVGDRVVPLLASDYAKHGNGSWQEFIAVKASDVVVMPDSITDGEAAQFFVNPWTCLGLYRSINPSAGDWVIQTAATSVLGRQFIQLCKHKGVKVCEGVGYSNGSNVVLGRQLIRLPKHKGVKTVNLVRRPEAAKELLDLGADVVLSQDDPCLADKIRNATGPSLAVGAIDPVAGKLTKPLTECVREDACVYLYAFLGGADAIVNTMDLLFKHVKVTGYWVSRDFHLMSREERQKEAATVIDLIQQKVISTSEGPHFDLADVREAVIKAQEPTSKRGGGKVMLVG